MAHTREITRIVNLTAAGGATPSAVVFDAPCKVPFCNETVIISSGGVVWAAGNLDWEVFYSCSWASGAPFQSGSIPNTDVSQGSGNIAGLTKVFSVVYEDASFLPANLQTSPLNPAAGAAVVCEVTNNKAVPITVYVTFISEIINDGY